MQSEDVPMPSAGDSSPLPTVIPLPAPPTTQRFVLAPPPPPPPLPLSLAPSSAPASDEHVVQDGMQLMASFGGQVDALQRHALRQKKWALVLLLPHMESCSAPTSPLRSRPAWGPDAYHQPKRLFASAHVAENVLLWRRTCGSSDAEKYAAFFPTDGFPHVALLDPRSGERLCVWGNEDGKGMSEGGICDGLWEDVLKDLDLFLEEHTLEDGALGPLHMAEKSWAARTRRVGENGPERNLQSTAVMDDEDAAIAAAIAASLAESEPHGTDEYHGGSSSDGDVEDDDSEEMYTDSSDESDEEEEEDYKSDDIFASHGSIDDNDDKTASESTGSTVGDEGMPFSQTPVSPPASRPVLIPPRREIGPSSVESLSSSYLDRMDSCFRSSTNPSLVETRRLRQEQDAELAASLQEDRERETKEEEEMAARARKKEFQLEADARLPDEPKEGKEFVTIAIRMADGSRILRRLNSFDTLSHVADLAIARIGCVSLKERIPKDVLRVAGGKVGSVDWNVTLMEMGLSGRAMVMLNL